jgi:sulfur-oxidizing protein SoxY
MPVPALTRARCFLAAAMLVTIPAAAGAATSTLAEDDASGPWSRIRLSLFGARPLADGADDLTLGLPRRAEDAATVPVTLQARGTTPRGLPRKLYLVIDENPSPVAAVFELGRAVGLAHIETRVRIEDYTAVRVIAEYANGSLAMVEKFIKAAGGCSAPASRREGDGANLGQMRWQLPDNAVAGEPALATLLIRHPNSSGLAMDQLTRLYAPPHFVRSVAITYTGRLVLSADVDFSISENPAFRFAFTPDLEGVLRAEVTDSNALTFESRVEIRAAPR